MSGGAATLRGLSGSASGRISSHESDSSRAASSPRRGATARTHPPEPKAPRASWPSATQPGTRKNRGTPRGSDAADRSSDTSRSVSSAAAPSEPSSDTRSAAPA